MSVRSTSIAILVIACFLLLALCSDAAKHPLARLSRPSSLPFAPSLLSVREADDQDADDDGDIDSDNDDDEDYLDDGEDDEDYLDDGEDHEDDRDDARSPRLQMRPRSLSAAITATAAAVFSTPTLSGSGCTAGSYQIQPTITTPNAKTTNAGYTITFGTNVFNVTAGSGVAVSRNARTCSVNFPITKPSGQCSLALTSGSIAGKCYVLTGAQLGYAMSIKIKDFTGNTVGTATPSILKGPLAAGTPWSRDMPAQTTPVGSAATGSVTVDLSLNAGSSGPTVTGRLAKMVINMSVQCQ